MVRKLVIAAVIVLVLSMNVYALETNLNISMSEIVYNNVTFARNFDLVETNPFCEIHGTMNISNPGTHTIADTYIAFTNINRMITDFIYVQGKSGSMAYGGAQAVDYLLADIGPTANDYTMTIDLDDDGATDYFWANDSLLYFNLSSEPALITIPIRDGALPVSIAGIGVDVNMSQTLITGSMTYGNLTILGTTTVGNELTQASFSMTINESAKGPMVIHIPELRPGNFTVFKYNITCANTLPPVDLNTNYSNVFHPNINRKVLAGYNWTVFQEARNSLYLGLNVTNINISIRAMSVLWNTSVFNFSLEELMGTGDYGNTGGNGTSNLHWWWTPSGGTLEPNESVNITYIVKAPDSVPFTATYLAIEENVTYDAAFLMSNITIIDVNASAVRFNQSLQKKIYQPSDNANNHNVTWEIRPDFIPDVNISYQLNKFTMWVTYDLNPNNYTGLNVSFSGAPLKEVNLTTSWGNSSYYWYFNYTDGSNASYPPPIVWMKPEFVLTNKYAQILNYSRTVSGNDIYMKYIYVIHGYWLEVNKNITSIGEGQYKIYSYVENIGNGWTPQFEYVTVYDFVPIEFIPYNFSDITYINQSVGTAGSDFYGTSFRWNIPWKGGMNASLGPKNGPDATSWNNYSWNVTYYVNGTGDYRVSELYIIGLDPLKVDGASATPVISVIAGLQSYSKELIYVSIVGFLIILNITNLIMTNRISKKLDEPPVKKHKHSNEKHKKQ